ncbi:hypothetical protein AcW1_004145 [Taiwanofungus camphoratus]|nr:hypothetical protein AcW2_006844 [Antrodia cinnamomea]KAI0938991.1 hypothetical protein AcV5_000526 [Antrodia cinnamomea]KAI0951906.1 hypothetical protein AcV7_007868 [Antrodia cinnamomea]KAI0959275.1 hypothetical protein AcW1_004145 [Antrodia cinnamomea]
MFRFEREDKQDIVWCYFLQVCSESRHCGLGKQLIQQLLSVSGQWCMRKLMLAVLKKNLDARKFYSTMGFDTEVKGEGGNKITEGTECDFEILSKNTPLQM